MSITVDKAFVQQFSDNLIILAQQRGSRLAGRVMRKDVTGKFSHFDRLGATVATKRTSRHGDTPLIDIPHSRRRVILEDWETADLIDNQDEIRMLIDPRSSYAQAMGFALGRTLDDIIIDAADGDAIAVDASDSTTTVPVKFKVDEDFGAANSDITIEKLIESKRILMSNEVQPDEEFIFVADAQALASLLNETEIQSADFNTVRALVAGEIKTFMGYEFVQSERINENMAGLNIVNCLAYAKTGIGLAMGDDIKVRMSERDDKSYATQVYASLTAGATRIEEEKVVVVEAFRAP